MTAPVVTPQRGQQSPIHIVTPTTYYAPGLQPLAFHYGVVSGRLIGHDIVLERRSPSTLLFHGMQCPLRKLHFHAPGEHRIDGSTAELELHLVHEIPDYPERFPSAYVVVGVLLRIPFARTGDDTHAVRESLDTWLEQSLRNVCAPPTLVGGAPGRYEFDVSQFLPADLAHYRYEGSLTTGDCDEFVAWVVLRDRPQFGCDRPLQLDPESARIVQPLARRFVLRSFP